MQAAKQALRATERARRAGQDEVYWRHVGAQVERWLHEQLPVPMDQPLVVGGFAALPGQKNPYGTGDAVTVVGSDGSMGEVEGTLYLKHGAKQIEVKMVPATGDDPLTTTVSW